MPCAVSKKSLTPSCRTIARHPSPRSGRRPGMSSRGTQAPRDPSHTLGVTKKERLGGTTKERLGVTALFCRFERSEKSPHPVMPLLPVLPSDSEGPLTSFGTASLRRPLVLRLGATKKGARGDKKVASGRQRGACTKTFLIQPHQCLRAVSKIAPPYNLPERKKRAFPLNRKKRKCLPLLYMITTGWVGLASLSRTRSELSTRSLKQGTPSLSLWLKQ